MNTGFTRAHNYQPSRTQRFAHRFNTITHNDQMYRILAREHQATTVALHTWRAVWVVISCGLYGGLLHSFGGLIFGAQNMPDIVYLVYMMLTIGLMWACSLVWKYKDMVGRMTKFSTINCTMLFVISTIMLYLDVPYVRYPTLIYICAQTVGSLFFMYNRSQLMGKFLLMLQILLINLKLDGQIQAEMHQVVLGFLFGHFIGTISFISMILFFIINVVFFREPIKSIKHIGLLFISLHSLSMALSCDAPIMKFIFSTPHQVACILAIIVNIVNIYFNKCCLVQISLFLCKTEPVKSYNQIISLAVIDKQKYKDRVFLRKSDNWYEEVRVVDNVDLESDIQLNMNIQAQQQPRYCPEDQQMGQDAQKCLICLQTNANVLWYPCGHLTVCEYCCDRMFDTKVSDCLLCKRIPSAIYYVKPISNNSVGSSKEEISSEKSIGEHTTQTTPQLKMPSNQDTLMIKNGYSVRIC